MSTPVIFFPTDQSAVSTPEKNGHKKHSTVHSPVEFPLRMDAKSAVDTLESRIDCNPFLHTIRQTFLKRLNDQLKKTENLSKKKADVPKDGPPMVGISTARISPPTPAFSKIILNVKVDDQHFKRELALALVTIVKGKLDFLQLPPTELEKKDPAFLGNNLALAVYQYISKLNVSSNVKTPSDSLKSRIAHHIEQTQLIEEFFSKRLPLTDQIDGTSLSITPLNPLAVSPSRASALHVELTKKNSRPTSASIASMSASASLSPSATGSLSAAGFSQRESLHFNFKHPPSSSFKNSNLKHQDDRPPKKGRSILCC